MKIFGSWKELVSLVFRKNGQEVTVRPNQTTTYTADRDIQLPPGDAAHVLTSATSTQALTNKTIDGDDNTVQDLPLTAIKTALADANKVLARDAAGVPVSKLVENVNVSASAAIDYSKLSVPNNSIPEAKLTTVLGDADKVLTRDAAGVPVSEFIDNANISPTAAIAYSKLNIADGDLTLAKISTVIGDADKVLRRDAAGVPVSGNAIPNSSALLTTDAAQVVTAKDIDGGTASNTNRVTLPKNILASLNALTRKEATVLYATDTKKLYLDDGNNLIPAGSGSGSGEINAVLNPNDANEGWTAGTSHTVSSLSSGSPLDPSVPSGIRITASANTAESNTSGGAYTITSMPLAIRDKKLKLEFYYTTPASGSWTVSVYRGATRVVLSSDVSGVTTLPTNVTDKFVAYLDADSSASYTVRFTRTAGSGSSQLDLTSVIVGPGIQANSAIVGQLVPWTPFTSWAPNATWTGNWRQVGQFVEYFVEGSFTNTTSSGVLDVDLPVGHVVSTSLFKGPSATLSTISSSGAIYNGSTAVHRVSVTVLDSDTVRVVYASTAGDQLANLDSAGTPVVIGAGSTIRFEFKLPIVAFEGAGTVNVSTPDVEYVYNSDLSDANNTTSFAYGAEGTEFGNFTAVRTKDVRSKYPIGPHDVIELEVSASGGTSWLPVDLCSVVSSLQAQGSFNYGMYFFTISETDIRVGFGDYRLANAATFGGAASPWSDIDNQPTYKWRIKITRGPSAVGFSTVSQVQSGLVKRAGQLLGTSTNDNAEVGHVGEYLQADSGPIGVINNSTTSLTSITLSPGDWDVWGYVDHDGASGLTSFRALLSNIVNLESGFGNPLLRSNQPSGQPNSISIPAYRVSTATSFTVFVTVTLSGAGATTRGAVYARRVR